MTSNVPFAVTHTPIGGPSTAHVKSGPRTTRPPPGPPGPPGDPSRSLVDARIDGIDQQPQRLFLAVRPTGVVADRLALLPRPEIPGVRWAALDQLHVTLRFLGSARADDVIAAVDAADLPRVRSFRLGPEVTRFWQVVVALPAHALDELAATVAVVTGDLGTNRERRPFVGHLTLARLRSDSTPCPLLGHGLDAVVPDPVIELIASEQTGDGHRYTTIHRWPPTG